MIAWSNDIFPLYLPGQSLTSFAVTRDMSLSFFSNFYEDTDMSGADACSGHELGLEMDELPLIDPQPSYLGSMRFGSGPTLRNPTNAYFC